MSDKAEEAIIIKCDRCKITFSRTIFEEPFRCPNCGEQLLIFMPRGEICQVNPKNIV